MALLNSKPKSNKIAVSLRFEEVLLKEIKAYQEWAGIDKLNDFFEQSARFILEKDKDWIKKESQNKTEQSLVY
jgi:hypothetical protein